MRERLSRKCGILGGIATPCIRFLNIEEHWPNSKEANINGIRSVVSPSDTVVEVGSSSGVCTVWCSRMAYDGHVISYEASSEMVDITNKALKINGEILRDDIPMRVDVHHAPIGTEVDVWGSAARAESIPPPELPDCDVLVTDCEVAELNLIKEMEIKPRAAIIEVHPNKGVKTESVIAKLEKRGYSVSVRDDDEEKPTVEIVTAELS